MSTQFLVNEKGEKVAAVIPIAEYYELMEDLAEITARRNEPTVPYEEVRKEMVANGLLQH